MKSTKNNALFIYYTSSGVPRRLAGIPGLAAPKTSNTLLSRAVCENITPGATQFTRTPLSANSIACDLHFKKLYDNQIFYEKMFIYIY